MLNNFILVTDRLDCKRVLIPVDKVIKIEDEHPGCFVCFGVFEKFSYGVHTVETMPEIISALEKLQ